MTEKNPEAKLLDLIRKSGRPKSWRARLSEWAGRLPGAAASVRSWLAETVRRKDWRARLREGTARLTGAASSLRSKLASGADGIAPLKALNTLVGVLLLISFVYLVSPRSSARSQWRASAEPVPAPQEASQRPPRPFSYYKSTVASRDLFGPAAHPTNKKAGPTAARIAAGLRIMGFVGSGRSIEALVLDSRTKTTSYVRRGDTIRGLWVEDIGGGRMVLSQNGEKVTLSF